jgi:hypothetical protein
LGLCSKQKQARLYGHKEDVSFERLCYSFPKADMSQIQDFPNFVDSPETIAFVGENHLAFREAWLRAYKKAGSAEKAKTRPSVNFAALLAFPFWCGYRKICRPLVFFTLLFCTAILFEIFTGIFIPLPFYVVFILIMGMLANGFYLDRVMRFFGNLQETEPEIRAAVIQKKGGTSIIMGIVSLLAFNAILMGAYFGGLYVAETAGLDISHITSR